MASPEEMKQITAQFQQNAGDLQAYLRDLDNWHQDIQAKDDQLRKKKPQASSEGQKKVKIEEIYPEPSEPKKRDPLKGKRISSYDYDKWDKFDAEKAIEEVEAAEKIEVIDEDESYSAERLRQQAVFEKERGNDFFKRGEFDKAIDCYTRGINCDPNNALIVANRAMALLKKDMFEAAEADCTVALALDPTYVKALQRRAAARAGLKRTSEALEDYNNVLKLDPKNKQARHDMVKLQEKVEIRQEENFKENHAANEASTKVKVVPPENGGQPINDEEIKIPTKSFEENIRAAFTTRPNPSASTKAATPAETECKKKPLIRIPIKDVNPVTPMRMDTSMSSSKTVVKGQTELEEEICATLKQTQLENNRRNVVKVPSKPQNAVQFHSIWSSLLSLEQKSEFLKRRIRSNDYQALFKHSLEPEIFEDMIEVIAAMEDADEAVEHLFGLSKVPRISALIMFMSEDKRKLAVNKVKNSGKREKVEKVNKTFI